MTLATPDLDLELVIEDQPRPPCMVVPEDRLDSGCATTEDHLADLAALWTCGCVIYWCSSTVEYGTRVVREHGCADLFACSRGIGIFCTLCDAAPIHLVAIEPIL